MEKNKLQCEIVQDLLPSYVDGLTSEVTNEAVENLSIFANEKPPTAWKIS